MACLRQQIIFGNIIYETEVFMILYKTLFFCALFYTYNIQFMAEYVCI
jgi:hypothetical protein